MERAHGLTRDEIREHAIRSVEAQGLKLAIEDPATCRKLAQLIYGTEAKR